MYICDPPILSLVAVIFAIMVITSTGITLADAAHAKSLSTSSKRQYYNTNGGLNRKHNNHRMPDINPEELTSLGISSEDIMQHLRHLSDGNYNCGRHTVMTLHYVRNKTVTCNDGSPSGYYLRRSLHSTKWLVYLDGGWFCFDEGSCHRRWLSSSRLMSSYDWTISRKGSGILSADKLENPHMHDINTVVIPYCSSDVWSGTRQPRTKNDFAFLGALILEEVIKDLVYAHGLTDASKLFMAGSSAGGTGVLINLDRIAGILAHIAPQVQVRGIVDSGWFLDNQQYKASECRDVYSCSPTASIQRGMQFWDGVVPETCKKLYTASNEHWRCYFGYRLYPTLKTPVFVVQHLFDQAQITADNVGSPVKKEQWQYIHDIGYDMRQTLLNVSAVFAPSCLSHILLTGGDWNIVTIRGVTLPQAIHCWESSNNERNLYSRSTQARSYVQMAERLITGESGNQNYPSRDIKPQADAPRNSRRKQRHKRKHDQSKRGKRKKLRDRELRRKRKVAERERERKEKAARRVKEKEERRKQQRAEKLKRIKAEKQRRREIIKAERKLQQTVNSNYNNNNQPFGVGSGSFSKPESIIQHKPPQIDTGVGLHNSQQKHTEVSHHITVYDYVVENPGSFYEHSKSHKSTSDGFYFNPLHARVKNIVATHKATPSSQNSRSVKEIIIHTPVKEAITKKTSQNADNKMNTQFPLRHGKAVTNRNPNLSSTRTTSKIKNKPNKQKRPRNTGKNNNRELKIPPKFPPKRRKKKIQRSKRSSLVFDDHDVHHMEYHDNQCNHHRIDHCEWPQCNPSCPKFINHFTGEEVDFIDVVMQFGLDVSSIASSLNMDEQTMYQMDRNQLLSLLINT